MKRLVSCCVLFGLALATAVIAEEKPTPAVPKADPAAATPAPAVAPMPVQPVVAPPADIAKPADVTKPVHPLAQVMEDLVLEGKIAMVEMTGRKDGKSVKMPRYILTLADGTKVPIPPPRPKKDEIAIDLAQYVDKVVKLEGKGRTRMMKDKKFISILTVSKIETVGGAAAAPTPEVPKDAASVPPATESPKEATKTPAVVAPTPEVPKEAKSVTPVVKK